MRKLIGICSTVGVAAVAAIVLVFLRTASEPSGTPPLHGTVSGFSLAAEATAAPNVNFTNADGAQVSLYDFKGKVVLLNLWATWCAPCVKELPDLDRLQASLGGSNFQVVALSSDRNGAEKVPPFLKNLRIANLTPFLDPDSVATRAFSPRGLPTTVLIDAAGREVGRLEGAAEWDSPEARDLIGFYINRSG